MTYVGILERALAGSIDYRVERQGEWVQGTNLTRPLPVAGWKVHISALEASAESTVTRSARVAVEYGCHIKVGADVTVLREINSADSGSQIGKFITVYPPSGAPVGDLILGLVASLDGQRGPLIPFDVRAARGSPVHYRWGEIEDSRRELVTGRISHVALGFTGEPVADTRDAAADRRNWPPDPLQSVGRQPAPSTFSRMLADRYVVMEPISLGLGGSVHHAIDLQTKQPVVVKATRRDALLSEDGWDRRDLLHNEYAVLQTLREEAAVPLPVDLVDDGEFTFLVVERFEGVALDAVVGNLATRGNRMASGRVVDLARRLAALLCRIQARGVTYGDLVPTHVLLIDHAVFLLDHELAFRHGDGGALRGYTPRFGAPEVEGGTPLGEPQLVYGFGAVIGFAALGGAAPPKVVGGLLRQVRPDLGNLGLLVERCLAESPADRPRLEELPRLTTGDGRHPPSGRIGPVSSGLDPSRLLVEALDHHDLQGYGRDINDGLAGALLVLSVLPDSDGSATLLAHQIADILCRPPPPWRGASGLLAGEAGVGLSLLMAGNRWERPDLVSAGERALEWSLKNGWADAELYAGMAGRMIAYIRAAELLHSEEWLRRAVDLGEEVVDAAVAVPGGIAWERHDPDGPITTYIGMSHGAAGVAVALLDLHGVTAVERYREAAAEATGWVMANRIQDAAAGIWPAEPAGRPHLPVWCHGGGGIGRALMVAARAGMDGDEGVLDAIAERVLAAVHIGPTMCHGLPGSLRFLTALRDSGMIEWSEARDRGLMILRDVLAAEVTEALASKPRQGIGLLTGLAGMAIGMYPDYIELPVPV